MKRRPDLEAAIDTDSALVFGISKEMMSARDLGDVGQLIETAVAAKKLPRLVGRVMLMFPEYDRDPREVFEDAICGAWMGALSERFPYLPVLLEPTKTFPILMFCNVPWTKKGKKILPAEEEATQFILNCGMTAYAFAKWSKLDARPFAQTFLSSMGFGDVDAGLLDQYEAMYAQRGGNG